jgi:hypothetical protein
LTEGSPSDPNSARYKNALEGLTDKNINDLKNEIDPTAGKQTVGGTPQSASQRKGRSNRSASKIFQKIISGSWVKALKPKGLLITRKPLLLGWMRDELVGLIDRKTTKVTIGEDLENQMVVRQHYGVATYDNGKVEAPKTGRTKSSNAANRGKLKEPPNMAVATLETEKGKVVPVIGRSGRPTDPVQAVQVFATVVSRSFALSNQDPPPGLSKVEGQANTYSFQPVQVGLMDRNSFKSWMTALKSRIYDAGIETGILMGSFREARARPVESEKDFMKMIETIAETLFAADAPDGLSDSDKAELEKMGIKFEGGQLEITVAREGKDDVTVQIKKPIIQSHSFNVMAKNKKNVRQVLKKNNAGQLQMLKDVDVKKFPKFSEAIKAAKSDPTLVASTLEAIANNGKASKEEKLLAHCFHAQLTGKRIKTDSNPIPRALEKAEDQADMAVMLAIQCQLLNIVPTTFCKSGNDRTPLATICHLLAAETLAKDGGMEKLLGKLKGDSPMFDQDLQTEALKHEALIIENQRAARGRGERGLHTTFKVADNPIFWYIFGEKGVKELAKLVFIPDQTPKLKSSELKREAYTPKSE